MRGGVGALAQDGPLEELVIVEHVLRGARGARMRADRGPKRVVWRSRLLHSGGGRGLSGGLDSRVGALSGGPPRGPRSGPKSWEGGPPPPKSAPRTRIWTKFGETRARASQRASLREEADIRREGGRSSQADLATPTNVNSQSFTNALKSRPCSCLRPASPDIPRLRHPPPTPCNVRTAMRGSALPSRTSHAWRLAPS